MNGHIAVMQFVCWNPMIRIFNRHPVYSNFIPVLVYYVIWYLGHNPVHYNLCYIASNVTVWGYTTCYIEKKKKSNSM